MSGIVSGNATSGLVKPGVRKHGSFQAQRGRISGAAVRAKCRNTGRSTALRAWPGDETRRSEFAYLYAPVQVEDAPPGPRPAAPDRPPTAGQDPIGKPSRRGITALKPANDVHDNQRPARASRLADSVHWAPRAGDEVVHVLERRSHCVTIAGRGSRARSADLYGRGRQPGGALMAVVVAQILVIRVRRHLPAPADANPSAGR